MFLSLASPLRRKILRRALANYEVSMAVGVSTSSHAVVLAEVRTIQRQLDFIDSLPAELVAKFKDGE